MNKRVRISAPGWRKAAREIAAACFIACVIWLLAGGWLYVARALPVR